MTSSIENQEPYVFIRSKRLLRYTLWMALFILGVIGLVSTLFYTTYIDHYPMSGLFLKKWIGMLVVFCFVVFLMIGFFIKWRRASILATRPIVISTDHIAFGKDIVPFSAIASIQLIDIGRIFYERFYGATVHLSDGTSKFIAEQYYEDAPLLFQALESINQQHSNKNEYTGKTQQANLETEQKEAFDFNIFTSIEHLLNLFLLLMVLTALFKFLFFEREQPGYLYTSAFFLIISPMAYYLNSKISYYFIIDNNRLEIRNKFIFGFSKIYSLNDIKGALIYCHGMGRSTRNGIRIVMNNYQTFFYASNAFNKKKWQSLAEALNKRGIAVQNRLPQLTVKVP